jgi:glycosyltransferase involved in cell wall biosynthesis
MTAHHPHRAAIGTISDGMPRPQWSVMIPTYNSGRYLRETLASVLSQDPGPAAMQIEVVDDHSTQDDPATVVEEVGHGRVAFYRQPTNLGHTRNFETCLRRSRGMLVHLLHGDDCVRDGFYRAMEHAFGEHPEIGAAFCRYIAIDEEGRWLSTAPLEQPASGVLPNWLETIAVGQRLQAPCMTVRREVYERLGGFDDRIRYYGEDWEMWVRIAAHYPVWYQAEPLALYRVRAASLSGYSLRTGENVRDLRRVIDISRTYLPSASADAVSRKARASCALAALRRARRMLGTGDLRGPLAQTREALQCDHSPGVVARAAALLGAWAGAAVSTALHVRPEK